MPTTPILSRDLVTTYVTQTVGGQVIDLQPLPGSVANQDFLVHLAGDAAVVLKAGPRDEMVAEAWACRRLTEIAVPVPAVVSLDLDSGLGGLATLVLTFVAGAPSDSPAVALETGRWLRRVHAERLPGWGPLTILGSGAGSPARGRYDSWAEAIQAELSGLHDLVAARVVDERVARDARRCVLADDLLDYRGPGVLLHNDLKPAHLFGVDSTDGEHLAGIIDWGDARVGDPAAEIARLSMAGPAITDAFLAGYGLALTPELDDRLARYRIAWNVAALSYEHQAGGDWFDVYRGRIRDDVQLLLS